MSILPETKVPWPLWLLGATLLLLLGLAFVYVREPRLLDWLTLAAG